MEQTDEKTRKTFDLNRILLYARNSRASDVHFQVGYQPIMRAQGRLTPLDTEECKTEDLEELTKEILNYKQYASLPKLKNIDTALERGGFRHRVNVAYETKGNKTEPFIAIRLIPDKIMPVEDIGFPDDVWKNIVGWKDTEGKEDIPELKRGLVLTTGITGSGKTTTNASLINEINKTRAENIITLEDPIEYIYPKLRSIIKQREIGTSLNSFADGVKYALREDPDIIYVAEIRDKDTALHALMAAETGHLVFSTLHDPSATETVDRFTGLFGSDEQKKIRISLASNLAWIIAQLLIPCEKGRDRKLVMEVMNVRDTSAIRNHIREGKYEQLIGDMQNNRKYKNITFDQRLLDLYRSGELGDMTREEVLSYAHFPESLKQEIDKPKQKR